MAIIPVKNNYEESLHGQGIPHLNGSTIPDKFDVVNKAGSLLASAGTLLVSARAREDSINAQAKANEFGVFLDEQTQALNEKKGLNAYQDEDGNPMVRVINQNVREKLSEMTSGMSDNQRALFMRAAVGYNRSFNKAVSSYIGAQKQAYDISVIDDARGAHVKAALSNLDDRETVMNSLAAGFNLSREKFLRMGYDDQMAETAAKKDMSGMIRELAVESAKQGNLSRAEAIVNEYGDWITPEHMAAVQERIRTVRDVKAGEEFARQRFTSWARNKDFSLTGVNGDREKLNNPGHKARLFVESGGRDFDKSGNILISPAGALGASQVMPNTLKNPGLNIVGLDARVFDGVKENKDAKRLFDNAVKVYGSKEAAAAEINRVGMQYFEALVSRYKGDYTRAYAAYHSGMDVADKKDWHSHLKEQGKAAVAAYEAALESFSAPGGSITKTAMEAEGRKAGLSDSAIRAATSEISQLQHDYSVSEKETSEARLLAALQAADNGTTINQMKADGTFFDLTRKQQEQVEKHAARMQTGQDIPISEDATVSYNELCENPDLLMAQNLDLLKGKMPENMRKKLEERKEFLSRPDGDWILDRLSGGVKNVLQSYRIDVSELQKKKPDKARRLNDALLAEAQYLMKTNANLPVDQVIEKAAAKVVDDVIYERGWWHFSTEGFNLLDRAKKINGAERREMLAAARRDKYLAKIVDAGDEDKAISLLLMNGYYYGASR